MSGHSDEFIARFKSFVHLAAHQLLVSQQRITLAFEPFFFGNLPGDFGSADDKAFRVFDRRDRERYIDSAAVFGLSNCFEMIYLVTASYLLQNIILLRLPLGWDDQA